MTNNNEIKSNYTRNKSLYSKLWKNVCEAIETFLWEEKIEYLSVNSRTKKINSLESKLNRKKYSKLEDIEDICWIRIICFYQSDIKNICDIIEKEFDIQETQDKENLLGNDQFWYRSYHFIAKINEKWCEAPNYRWLKNLKFEIQIRTILMHAWAEIEHKLAYKSEKQIPEQFKRKFSLMSWKLEEIDEQFEDIRVKSLEYRNGLFEQWERIWIEYFKDIPVDLDTLQSFLDFISPKRAKSIWNTSELLSELIKYDISFKDIINAFEACEPYLEKIEREYYQGPTIKKYWVDWWAQVWLIRHLLDISNRKYFDDRSFGWNLPETEKIKKWRKKLFT